MRAGEERKPFVFEVKRKRCSISVFLRLLPFEVKRKVSLWRSMDERRGRKRIGWSELVLRVHSILFLLMVCKHDGSSSFPLLSLGYQCQSFRQEQGESDRLEKSGTNATIHEKLLIC